MTPNQVLFINSFPPRQCGIASYSHDLIEALQKKFSNSFSIAVCALENGNTTHKYPEIVKYVWHVSEADSAKNIALKINDNHEIGCVFIQHEFGLFNGEDGFGIVEFLQHLSKPVLTTFHSVLPNPNKNQRAIVKEITNASSTIFVMTSLAANILMEEYGIHKNNIAIVPHGTHKTDQINKNAIKASLGLKEQPTLCTFGFLSPDKNLEIAIEAVAEVKEKIPDVLYLIIGKTHPGILAKEGEAYRQMLENLVAHLGLLKNVKFIDKYVELDQLLHYLKTIDIYLFTSKNPIQAVSGTLAYAMASGCPVISTPIQHSLELIDEGTGIFVDFGNAHQFAAATLKLLENKDLLLNMSRNAIHKMESTAWENVSISHAKIINKVIHRHKELKYNLPEISLKHFYRMTTSIGIIQFSDLGNPDLNSGYTLDDNARALIAVSEYIALSKNFSHFQLLEIYLNFINRCQQVDGSFLNYVDQYGNFTSQNSVENLEDSTGRAVWALCQVLSQGLKLPSKFALKAKLMLEKALLHVSSFNSPRAISYAIKGLHIYNSTSHQLVLLSLSKKLANHYYQHRDAQWEWYEPILTYANSIMPEAMLYAYLNSGNRDYQNIAKQSFDFLISHVMEEKHLRVISNNGWKKKGKKVNLYGEQPIDAAKIVMALHVFYSVYKDEKYVALMNVAFNWFLGKNHLNQIVYNPVTGGCFDGLEKHNVNLNQGAESLICYTMARLAMEDVKKIKTPNYKCAFTIDIENRKTKKEELLKRKQAFAIADTD